MRSRAVLIGLVLATSMAESAEAHDLAVIVHSGRDVQLTTSQVAQIYLKKRRFWDDGERIIPINRNSSSEARRSFARLVFGEDAGQLVVYWNRQYFSGILPPATLASDEAVKRFVASEPVAIGYIAPALVDDSVRVVLRIHDPRGSDGGYRRVPGGEWLERLVSRLIRRSRSLLVASF